MTSFYPKNKILMTSNDDKFNNDIKPLDLGNEAREIRIHTGTLGHRLMECRFIIELLRQFNVITVEEIQYRSYASFS